MNLFSKIWLQDSNPVLVAFSEQMQAIVGIIRVHVLGSRSHELREEVDVGQATSVGDFLDQGIEGRNIFLAAHVVNKHVELWVQRQNALQIESGRRRFVLDPFSNLIDVLGDVLDAAAAGEVVNADQEEDLGWLALGDDVEAVEHGIGSIAADSTVLDVWVAKQFCPFTSVGDAVAQENDVLLAGWENFKECSSLIKESCVLASLSL